MTEQPSFLEADTVETVHSPGPTLTGQQEYSREQAAKLVMRMQESVADWQTPALPDLSRFDEVIIDLETTGLRWWDQDRLVGAAIWTPDGQSRYLPVRHQGSDNIPEGQFFEWCRREIRHKRVVNIRTKFDLHTFRADGIDLEAQGCTFGDVAHYAALLDDHRRLFNQEDLALAFLAAPGLISVEECKVKTANGFALDPKRFASYPAGLVAQRAESDVRIVAMLQQAMWPKLTDQDLHRVRALEDGVIPVVVEMEHNGAPIDVETLHLWCQQAQRDLEEAMWDVRRMTGVDLESPTKGLQRLFAAINLPLPIDPETGQVSFADKFLKEIPHPAIQRLRFASQIASLLSKFLLKYQRSTARDGILRYELHQLPYQDDDEGSGGAVSGRFSSAAPSRDEGANIQQVIGVKHQQEALTGAYIIKKLFKPNLPEYPDAVWMKADASQFQFRLFAHYAESPGLIQAYQRDYQWREILARAAQKIEAGLPLTKDDKLTDYHEAVQDLILEIAKQALNRTHTKNVNFAQVFGAGLRKMAKQLGVPDDQIPDDDAPLESGGPKFQEVVQISKTYHEMFPEVKPLLRLTSHLGMPDHKTGPRGCSRPGEQGYRGCQRLHRQGYSHRGWVRTIEGRRARFGLNDRHYSALNRVIQGSEGDVNKKVLIEVHKRRHELGLTMLFTVHDELDAILQDRRRIGEVRELLNTQYYDFRVPILWEVSTGPNWAEAK